MRSFFIVFIVCFLASCGNQKIRFVRTKSTAQKIVELKDTPSLKTKSETALLPNGLEETPESKTPTITEDKVESDESNNDESISSSKKRSAYIPKNTLDSSEVLVKEAYTISQEARVAEKQGTWSLTLSLLVYVFAIGLMFALLASAFGGAPSIALALVVAFFALSIGSLVGSFILGIKSLRASYNTIKGRKRAIAGIVISSIITASILLSITLSFIY